MASDATGDALGVPRRSPGPQAPPPRATLQALCRAVRWSGAPFMRVIGKGRWPKNPKYCSSCFKSWPRITGCRDPVQPPVRRCPRLDAARRVDAAERLPDLMGHFFRTASEILIEHDAVVDKFVGDEVVAIFIPALTGERHAARAIAAALPSWPGGHRSTGSAAHRRRRPHRHRLRRFDRGRRERRHHRHGRSRERGRPSGLGRWA